MKLGLQRIPSVFWEGSGLRKSLPQKTRRVFFFFCPDKAFSVAEIRDALSSFISIATLWLPVWQTVGGDGRGGTVKTESAGVFQIRVTLEFSTHLSLTVIDCLLMTLKEFLEKQEGIASKMSHLSHPLQTQIFQMLYFWVTV